MNKLKRILAGLSIGVMCLTAMPINASASEYVQGDINGDGSVTTQDLYCLSKFLSGNSRTSKGTVAERLDVNLDSIIDSQDIQYLKNHFLNSSNLKKVPSTYTTALPAYEARNYYKYDANTGNKLSSYTLNSNTIPEISTASNRAIIGDDDRVLDTTLKGVVNIGKNGTGFIIDKHTILTAAHCIYNMDSEKLETNLKIYICDGTANCDNATLTINPVQVHIPAKYANAMANYGEYDYAILTVKEDLSNYICFDLGVARDNIKSANPSLYVTGFGGGTERTTAKGNITGIDSGHITYNTDTIGGNSGSPAYIISNNKKIVVGIHNAAGNSSIRITSEILQFVYNNSNL